MTRLLEEGTGTGTQMGLTAQSGRERLQQSQSEAFPEAFRMGRFGTPSLGLCCLSYDSVSAAATPTYKYLGNRVRRVPSVAHCEQRQCSEHSAWHFAAPRDGTLFLLFHPEKVRETLVGKPGGSLAS